METYPGIHAINGLSTEAGGRRGGVVSEANCGRCDRGELPAQRYKTEGRTGTRNGEEGDRRQTCNAKTRDRPLTWLKSALKEVVHVARREPNDTGACRAVAVQVGSESCVWCISSISINERSRDMSTNGRCGTRKETGLVRNRGRRE